MAVPQLHMRQGGRHCHSSAANDGFERCAQLFCSNMLPLQRHGRTDNPSASRFGFTSWQLGRNLNHLNQLQLRVNSLWRSVVGELLNVNNSSECTHTRGSIVGEQNYCKTHLPVSQQKRLYHDFESDVRLA